MLSLVLWLLFGALVGWLASLVMDRDRSLGALGNIVVGVVGAAIGGFLFDREVDPNILHLGSVLTAFVGAVALLGAVNLFTRGRVR